MRCIALGEEFQRRGWTVSFAADTAALPWASEQLSSRSMEVIPAAAYDDVPGLLDQVAGQEPDVVVIDSYLRPRAAYAGLRRSRDSERPQVLALVDGDPDGREADVFLDQNIGAEDDRWDLPIDSIRLAGLKHALIRDDIASRRPHRPTTTTQEPPHVLCFFGGTDAMGAAPALTEALVRSDSAFHATVVAADDSLAAQVSDVAPRPGQSIDVVAPRADLAEQIAGADLVIGAGGTSLWELCCIGAAAAIVQVADNQAEASARAEKLGVIAGLGTLDNVRDDPDCAAARLAQLLGDSDRLASLRRQAWGLVDGAGRERVVDAVSARCAATERRPA